MTIDSASTKKAYKGMAMEGAIAGWCARNTAADLLRTLSPNML